MKKSKVNINRPKLSKEEIEAGKDFNAVLNGAKTSGGSLNGKGLGKLIGVISAIGVAIIVPILLSRSNEEVAFIEPIKGANQKFDSFEIDAQRDTVLMASNGTAITYNKGSLLNKSGKPVKGKVELKFRQFSNVPEIIASGIPMTYDSSGKEYHFESAGMIELRAFKGNKALFLDAEKKMGVEMVSKDARDVFNLYYLDEKKKNWQFDSKSKFEVVKADKLRSQEEVEADLQENEERTVSFKNKAPIEPKKLDVSKKQFKIDFKKEEFPELASLGECLFELYEEKGGDKLYNSTYEDILLQKNEATNQFDMVLFKSNKPLTYSVYPVYEGQSYEEAMVSFKKNVDQYNTVINELAKERQELQEELNNVVGVYKEEKRVSDSLINERKKAAFMASNLSNQVIRTYEINEFGIWNCDNPMALPSGGVLAVQFNNQDGKSIDLDKVYLIEKGVNGVYTYYNSYFDKIRFNPAAQNSFVGITKEGKLATFDSRSFRGLPENGKCSVNMNVIDTKFSSPEELESVLKDV